MTTCSEQNCARASVSRGLCDAHYRRSLGRSKAKGPIRPKGDLGARFMRYVAVSPDGCWLWTGVLHQKGYGTLSFGPPDRRRAQFAHRISYELHKGPIPDGMFVCHTCDNRRCVNPEHLWLGTVQDNQSDMSAKSRTGHGAFSHAQVRAIRWERAVAGTPHETIAIRVGVTRNSIWSLCHGITYRHSGGPTE